MDVWFLLKDEDRPQFLSFVVGHEYGHLVSKTKARGLRYLKKVCTVKFLAAGILGLNPRGESERRYRIAARAHHSGEFSADAFSARFCTELGYDSERGISAMELTEWLEGGDVAKDSLTHPSTKDRIERVLNSYHSTKTKPGAPAHPEELDEDPAPPPPHP